MCSISPFSRHRSVQGSGSRRERGCWIHSVLSDSRHTHRGGQPHAVGEGAPRLRRRGARLTRSTTRIAVEVEFTESVSVTTTSSARPEIGIEIGTNTRKAGYVSGSGSARLRFEYAVVAGDADTDGIAIPANALATPAGSAIRTAAGNRAVQLAHDVVGADAARNIDGVRPSATEAAVAGPTVTVILVGSPRRVVGAHRRGRIRGADRQYGRPGSERGVGGRLDRDAEPCVRDRRRHGERHAGIHPARLGREDPRRGGQRRGGDLARRCAGCDGHPGHTRARSVRHAHGGRRDAQGNLRRGAGYELGPGGAGRVHRNGNARRECGLRPHGEHALALLRRHRAHLDARAGGARRGRGDPRLCPARDEPAAGPGDDAQPGSRLHQRGCEGRGEQYALGEGPPRLRGRGGDLRDRGSDRGRGRRSPKRCQCNHDLIGPARDRDRDRHEHAQGALRVRLGQRQAAL